MDVPANPDLVMVFNRVLLGEIRWGKYEFIFFISRSVVAANTGPLMA